MSVFGVFLVRIFLHSDWIRRDTSYLRIQSECGKISTKETPNKNTFHAETVSHSVPLHVVFLLHSMVSLYAVSLFHIVFILHAISSRHSILPPRTSLCLHIMHQFNTAFSISSSVLITVLWYYFIHSYNVYHVCFSSLYIILFQYLILMPIWMRN